MKIRHGFVSNSSSSSFIVCFPEKIETKEQLSKYLDFEAICSNMEHRKIRDILFKDIQNSYKRNDDFSLEDADNCDIEDLMYDQNITLSDLKYKSLAQVLEENEMPLQAKLIYGDDYPEDYEFESRIAPFIFGPYLVSHVSNR